MAEDKWIQGAVPKSHEGLFTKQAERKGESVSELAHEKEHASGKTGARARFALNMQRLAAKRRGQKDAISKG